MTIQPYLDLITSEHKTKSKFTAWLSAALNIVSDTTTMTQNMPSDFDIDNAIGVQLDILGPIVGRSRNLNFQPSDGSSPTLDDKNYRIALKAKIAQNQWDGTIPGIYDIWNNLFPDLPINVVDNQNMTMSVLINGTVDPVINEMVASGYIIPKPMGVSLTIIQNVDVTQSIYMGGLVTSNKTINLSIPGGG